MVVLRGFLLSSVFVSATCVRVFRGTTSESGRPPRRGVCCPRILYRSKASPEACGKLNSVLSLVF